MATGKKTGGKNFAKGNKIGGRKALPADIKAARNLSYEDMCRTVIEVREMTPETVKKENMEKVPLGKRAIMNAYAKLDYRGIKDYEDRLWGKSKESVELSTPEDASITINVVGVDTSEKK